MNILESLHSLDERAEALEKADGSELVRTVIRPLINLVMAQERERLELLAKLDAQEGRQQESAAIKQAEGILG